ncbi:hypothetical protein [Kitasatospora sp. NPDC058218]|uniref:hypothetical protein n=1 Tax=Kitasatospora sp. NPDC058218 TaxID=3346385 RepID=UPI0036DD051A
MLKVARLSVRAFPAPPGLGGEQREHLLAADPEAFTAVRTLAEAILRRHLAAAPAGTVSTVRTCATAAATRGALHQVALALGTTEED